MADYFFSIDPPHGLVKRIMYKKYLQAFIPITQQAKHVDGRQLYTTVIIDGFAGAGRYGDGWPAEIERYGSPLIALMVSLNYFYQKLHGKDKIWGIPSSERDSNAEILDMVATMSLSDTDNEMVKPKIHLIFIEKEETNFESLKNNIAEVLHYFFPTPDASYKEHEPEDGMYHFLVKHPNYPISCELVNKKFTDFTPLCAIEWPSYKCLVFLDPFGFSQTPITHVEKFVGPGNSLLINFMSSYVNRFVANSDMFDIIVELYGMKYLEEKAVEKKMPVKYLPECIDYLVRQFKGECNAEPLNNIQGCTATYERMLKNVFRTNMSLTFEMRGKHNNIIYHLIFVTDHIKNMEIMKEAMNRCSQFEGTLCMSDYKFCRNGCELNLGNTEDVTAAADSIYEKFAGCSEIEVSQVKDYVLLCTPYVFRKKSLAVLETEPTPRLVNVIDAHDQRPRRKGTYPDGKTWYLTFRPTKRTVDLASSIYEQYGPNGNVIVNLNDIMAMFGRDDFTENALLMMAKENRPRCNIYYIDNDISKSKYVISSDRAWYIVFRPADIQQFYGQNQLIPGPYPISPPPPPYKQVGFEALYKMSIMPKIVQMEEQTLL